MDEKWLTRDEKSVLDEKVIDLIRRNITLAAAIVSATEQHFRVVDRSLQRLRKAGRIEYASPIQGWKLTQKEISHE